MNHPSDASINTLLIELAYFPPIGMLLETSKPRYKTILIEQHENYRKRTYRNRCIILGANGVLPLSVPLKKGKNQQQPIRSVKIAQDDHQNWQHQHWKSIQAAYGRAPFWDFYADELRDVLFEPTPYLFDLNWQLLTVILELLQIDLPLALSDTFQKQPPTHIKDARNWLLPNQSNLSIQGFTGLDFKPYPQVFENRFGFVANLSILDLMFCYGPQAYAILNT